MYAGYYRRVDYEEQLRWMHTRELLAQQYNLNLPKEKPTISGQKLVPLPIDKKETGKKATRTKKAPKVNMARVLELEKLLSHS